MTASDHDHEKVQHIEPEHNVVNSLYADEDDSDVDSLSKTRTDLLVAVSEKELRKLRARERRNGSVWFGLGTFGMIGWSVAVPALIGIALGLWLDRHWPTPFSWTLTMLFLGFGIGCLNAWYWVTRERHQIDEIIDGNGVDD
jgi:ATP synthase protein I